VTREKVALKRFVDVIKEATGVDFTPKSKFETLQTGPENTYKLLYNAGGGDFWIPSPNGGWHSLTIEAARRYLRIEHRLSNIIPEDSQETPAT